MKKKLIVALSLLSTFALASCFGTQNGTSNPTTNETPSTTVEPTPTTTPSKEETTTTPTTTPTVPSTTPTTTPSTVEPIVVRTKDRGTVDNTMESVDIPDAIKPGAVDSTEAGYKVMHLLENANGEYDLVALQTLIGTIGEDTEAEANTYQGYTVDQFDQATILEDGTTKVEITYSANKYTLTLADVEEKEGFVSGSGEFYAFQNRATLVAKPCIGYSFKGWYDGDTLLSEDKTYIFDIVDDMEITPKFEMLDSFKYFEFESDLSSCTILGLKSDAPLDIVIPENVTALKEKAFEKAKINSVSLPTTLNEIGKYAFAESSLLSVSLNSTPIIGTNAFDDCYKLIEVYNNSEYDLDPGDYDCGYLSYYAAVIHDSNTEPSVLVKNDDFTFAVLSDDPSDSPLLIAYDGNDKELVLPENVKVDDATITSYMIGANAFTNNTDISILTIPEAVTDIGANAFKGCENLLEIYNLSNDVDIDAGTSTNGSVGYYAKIVHTSLDEPRSVFVNDDVSYYLTDDGNGSFFATIIAYTVKDKDLVINQVENYLTGLDKDLFVGNKEIETVTLGEGVVYVGEEAFYNCPNIRSVVADYVEYIDIRGFASCTALTSVSLKKCDTIYNYAFNYCKRLRNVDMPKVEDIGAYAFESCYSLYQITLPETLESIDSDAFEDCYKIRQVINKSELSISPYSYSYGYVAQYAIDVTATANDFYTIANGFVTYIDDSSYKHLIAYIGNAEEVVVPDDIDIIDEAGLLYGEFKSLTIPETVSVSSYALYHCDNLEYLDIPCYTNDDLYYLFKGYSYYELTSVPAIKTLRLSDYLGSQYSDYFQYFENVETLDLACTITSLSSYNTFYHLTNLKNVYFEGTMADWCNFDFDEASDTPMYKASKFYIKDPNGDITLGSNKFTEIDELSFHDTVTSIGDYQFYGFSIDKLVIPDTLTTIGKKAFGNCRELTDITYNNLTTISEGLFSGCSSLVEFNIPDTVETIGQDAFAYCTSLKRINLTNNITSIDEEAFCGCSSLTNITIPSSIDTISDYVFMNCYGLQKVVFEGNIMNIGQSAFQNCYVLNDLTLPSTVASIGYAAFKNCETMRSFSFKELAITEIAPYLFAGCRSLSHVDFSDMIDTVGEHAFDNCNKIGFTKYNGGLYFGPESNPYEWLIQVEKNAVEVEVSDECEIIIESAFQSCRALKKLIIPNSITSLGRILKGQYSNPTLEYLEIPFIGDGGLNSRFNQIFLPDNAYSTYSYVPSTLKTVKITGAITAIGTNAFKDAKYLQNVIIPDTVTEISDEAFKNCGITSFDLKNVTTIGQSAFYESKLESITISNKVTSIDSYAFYNCTSLKTVDMSNISNTCTIGNYMFTNCSLLSNIDLGSANWISSYMFQKCSSLEEITIPSTINSIATYAFSESGLKTIDLSQMADGKVISTYAFYKCSKLTDAVLPNVSVISSYLFNYCTSLENCNIPSTVTEIQAYAFEDTILRTVTLPAGINKQIGSFAFGNNSNLESVTVNCTNSIYGNTSIFSGSSKIKTVVIGEGCTTIYSNLFYNKSSLTSVTIPSTVTNIQTCAFQNCSSLTTITLPESLTTIGDNAFNGCTKLLEVYNLSYTINLTIGETSNGYAAYYAQAVHTSLTEESIYQKDSNGYTFIAKDGKGYLFAYEGTEENIILPTSFELNGVTYVTYDIYSCALKNNDKIKSVTIPGTVKVICEQAFYGCTKLTDVVMEEGLEYIDGGAFDSCSALENMSIPSSLIGIRGSSSYGSFGNLNYYKSDYGDKYLGNENNHYLVFVKARGSNISTLNIEADCKILAPYSASSIAYDYDCTVTLPEGLKYIGANAFSSCYKLKNVVFPSTLEYIGDYAFNNAGMLQKVLLENTNVEYIGYYAFNTAGDSNHKLATITLPETLKHISGSAFAYSIITDVKIPMNVEYVDSSAFSYCGSLKNIEIASKNTKFTGNVFYKSEAIEKVYYDRDIADWATLSFDSTFANPMYTETYNKTTAAKLYVLDDNGTITYNEKNYKELDELVIDDIEEIGSYAFYNLTATSVTISKSVKKIDAHAFYNCSKLQKVFYDGSISDWLDITFVDEYSNPMYYAFNFYVLDTNGTINHNGKSYSLLTNATITGEITKVSNYAFLGFSSLVSITLPDTITEIGTYAFYNCSGITNITLPANLTSIGNYAFSGCLRLDGIDLPNTITEIGNYAFANCISLTDVELPSLLTAVSQFTFSNCYNLTNITIPVSVTRLNDRAFENCTSLQNVYYKGTAVNWSDIIIVVSSGYPASATPMYYASKFYLIDTNGTTTYNGNTYSLLTDLKLNIPGAIKAYSFYGFNCLNYLELQVSVTTISSYAFFGCDHLYIARLGMSMSTIGSEAFTNCFRLAEVHYYNNANFSLPTWGKGGYGNVKLYAYGDFYGSYYNNTLFDLDTDGHIITSNGYIIADVFTNYGFLIDYIGDDTDLVLPSSFTHGSNTITRYGIAKYAFYKNDRITSLTIPSGVLSTYDLNGTWFKQIGDYAFEYCNNLTKVVLPNNVESFGSNVFKYCMRLYEVYHLKENSDLDPGDSSYGYVAERAKVVHKSLDEPSIITRDSNGFMFMKLEVNNEDKYYAIGYAGTDKDITLPSSFEFESNTITDYEIYQYGFREYQFLRSITIPANIKTVNQDAFYDCNALINADLPDTVTSLGGGGTYECCYSLISVKVPSRVISMGYEMLRDCNNLTEVIIPTSIKSIANYVFHNDSKLERIFYEGTASQWEGVTISTSSDLSSRTVIFYYSDTEPTTPGNYWHYDTNNKPVAW